MKKAWSFIKKHKIIIGGVWAFVTTCLSLYLSFFPPEQNPKLTIYQKAKFDAFTVDQSIDDIQILFNGIDIRKSGSNLKIFKYKITNNGKRDIKISDYVDQIPFGIEIINGKVARVGIANAHITGNILNRLNDDSTLIVFNKLFIGKGDFVNIDIWIIHKKGGEPEVTTRGRIADTNIEITTESETDSLGLFDTLRTLLAFALLILGLMGGVFVIHISQYCVEYFARYFIFKRKVGNFYDSSNRIHRFLMKYFCKMGKVKFVDLMTPLLNKRDLNTRLVEEKNNTKIVEEFTKLKIANKVEATDKKFYYTSVFVKMLETLKIEEFADEDNNEIIINEIFINELTAIIKRLNQ